MSRHRSPVPLMVLTVLSAIVLALVPLPQALAALRPYWLALVVAYWVLESPEHAGLGFAFAGGLLADLAHGSLLGEQALRMVMLAFIIDRFRNRLRFFPVWQQAMVMGGLLLNDRLVSVVVHAMTATPQLPVAHWLSPVVGAFLWGPLFLVLDTLRLRRGRG